MTPRRRAACVACACVLLAVACGAIYVRRSTPVRIDAAVDRFRVSERAQARPTSQHADERATPTPPSRERLIPPRPSAAAPPASAPRRPAAGVYVYRTAGWEEADVAGRRDYPDETTMTIRHTNCGYSSRWDVLDEHWTEQDTCLSSRGDVMLRYITYIEQLQHGERHEFICDNGTLSRPDPVAAVGTTWTGRCASESDVATFRGLVVGREPAEVGTTPVDTIHYRVEAAMTGRDRGSSRIDVWVVPTSGLIVRKRSSSTGEAQRAITVRYREEYEISLVSLEPRK